MARRKRRRSRAPRTFWVLAAVAAAVAAYHFFGDRLRWQAGLAVDTPPPRASGHLRVVSWNLHNFPAPDQDLELLRERLLALDADVLAIQEIKKPGELAKLVPELELLISEHGGSGGQKVGFLYDPSSVELVGEPSEHRELTMKGRVRPAYHAYFRRRHGGPDLHAIVVHLKARPDGLDLRREQWKVLTDVVDRVSNEGDPDVLVLGDFNTTGPEGGVAQQELEELDATMARAGLARVPNSIGCSAYWDGKRRDAWQEASLLDLAYIGGLEETNSPELRSVPAGHCARHQCTEFRSTQAYPDLDYESVSDHCPLVIDLPAGRDDD